MRQDMMTAFDPTAIIRLTNAVETAVAAGRKAQRPVPLAEPKHLCLAILGPARVGKSTFVNTLLGVSDSGLPALASPSSLKRRIPVEFYVGTRWRLRLGSGIAQDVSARWWAADHKNARALVTDGIDRARVETPSSLLSDWRVTILDFPGIESVQDLDSEIYDDLNRSDLVVFYLIPARGMSDADVDIIERLHGRPLIVCEALHESELRPSRSLLRLVEAEMTSARHIVPLVTLRVQNGIPAIASYELETLRLCLALLMMESYPKRYAKDIERIASGALRSLRNDITKRLDQIYEATRLADQARRLRATADLLALERDCVVFAPLESALSTAASMAASAAYLSTDALRTILRDRTLQTIDRYNVEAGQKKPPPTQAQVDPNVPVYQRSSEEFGARYVAGRRDLRGFIKNILAQHDILELTEQERTSLEAAVENVECNRAELAMLGGFSSGKSSLVNAILGGEVSDRRRSFLPTSVEVETATVNFVEYAAEERINRISWLESTTLTFLSEGDEEGQFKIHGNEIQAFNTWLERQEVEIRHCEFEPLSVQGSAAFQLKPGRGGAGRQSEPDWAKQFKELRRSLGFPNSRRSHAYLTGDDRTPQLPKVLLPMSVKVNKFRMPCPTLTLGMSMNATFTAVKDHAVALRIKYLHLGFGRDVLRHLTILDTPGTDAPVPHHREVAHGVIRDRRCPVIYCFSGHMAGGLDDMRNLRHIGECADASQQRTRFFFVITRRGDFQRHEADEISRRILDRLTEAGIPLGRVYFTEVVKERNQDFIDLVQDVSQFVQSSAGPLFRSWTAQASAVMETVWKRHSDRLAVMAMSERERAKREEELRGKCMRLGQVLHDLDHSPAWGVPWGEKRIATIASSRQEEIMALVDGLVARDDFKTITRELRTSLDELNGAVHRSLRTICDGLTGKFVSSIYECCGGLVASGSVNISSVSFPTAELLETVANLKWRGVFTRGFQRLGGTKWNQDIADNRNLIKLSWGRSSAAGKKHIEQTLTTTIDHLRREGQRIKASLEVDLACRREEASPKKIEAAKRMRDQAGVWVDRFVALSRRYDDSDEKVRR